MQLNKIFCSNMVFSANKPIRVFGTGLGKANITFNGVTKQVKAESENWLVEFNPMGYGGPYTLIFETENQTKVLEDIYIGEVILFAGQSNIQVKMKSVNTPKEKYEANDSLRMYFTDRIEETDRFTSKDGWLKADLQNISDWSAIGYLTLKELYKQKNIKIGGITCYQGASVIEGWVPEGTFQKHGINIDLKLKHPDHYYEPLFWNSEGDLYNQVFKQIPPFSVSAVVWYQGESDTRAPETLYYKDELKILIDIWRKDLANNNLPFIVVQLADYVNRNDDAWKQIQQAQVEVQYEMDFVKTVISADISENDNIHPPTKDKLSNRIANAICEFLNN